MAAQDEASPIECRLVCVHGRVQGIGYRDACMQQARALGITGWVRNRLDESVEVLMQGAPRQLDAMSDWLRDGMPWALVDRLETTPMPPPFARLDRFERRPTL